MPVSYAGDLVGLRERGVGNATDRQYSRQLPPKGNGVHAIIFRLHSLFELSRKGTRARAP